jgi:mannose/fructose/N-acetylgalactosamine-specific phosphotransferase system component IID
MQQCDLDTSPVKGVGFGVLWRSFFLETLWNYQKLQNVGFAFCIYPVLAVMYPDEDERRDACSRQLDAVNTHPAMGPLLAGICARLEADGEPSGAALYRKRIMAALGGFGDRVFWGRVKPLSSCAALFVSLALFATPAGCVVLLVSYNIPNLYARSLGFSVGWNEGLEALKRLKRPALETAHRGIHAATLWLVGAASALCLLSPLGCVQNGLVSQAEIWALALPAFFALSFWLLRIGASLTIVVYIIELAVLSLLLMVIPG